MGKSITGDGIIKEMLHLCMGPVMACLSLHKTKVSCGEKMHMFSLLLPPPPTRTHAQSSLPAIHCYLHHAHHLTLMILAQQILLIAALSNN